MLIKIHSILRFKGIKKQTMSQNSIGIIPKDVTLLDLGQKKLID